MKKPGQPGFPLHYVKLFLAPVIWGGALVAGRVVAVNLPPFTTTFLRFVAVTFFLLPVLYLQRGRLPRPSPKAFVLTAALSLSGVLLFNFFLFSGLRTVTAVRSSVIIAFTPAVVALTSTIFFRERINTLMGLGIAAAFVGAVAAISEGNISLILKGGLSAGDFFLLGCVLSWTMYSITAKYAMKELSPMTLLAYSSALGAVLLIPLALFEGGLSDLSSQPPETWYSLLYLSVGSAGIAYLFYYEGIKAVGPSRSAIFMNLEPVAAIGLGILILGESLSLPVAVGAGLVIGGLVLTNYRKYGETND